MISGLVTTAASMPVDIVKTRWVHLGQGVPCSPLNNHRCDMWSPQNLLFNP